MLRAQGLGRRYGRHWALRGLDLDLGRGVTAALGPNGAGKTTLLRLLSGLDRPQEGRVLLGGRPLEAERGLRGAIGLVTHQPRLYPQLSALEQLRFHAWIHQGRPLEPAAAQAMLDAEGLGAWARRPCRVLSRGLAQRLALACALLPRPRILLLDEPFSGLDPAACAVLSARLRAAADAGVAILLTTHDLERLPGLADRLWVLRGGGLLWQGPLEAGVDAAWLQARYRQWMTLPLPDAAAAAGTADLIGLPGTAAPVPDGAPIALPAPPGFPATLRALLWKDLRVEARGREALLPALSFGLVVTVVFQFGLPRALDGQAQGAAGALWAALLFATVLAQGRALAAEQEAGGLLGLRAAPVDLGAVFVAKWLAAWLTGAALLLVLLPAQVVWLGLPAAKAPLLGLVALLGLVGWCAAGTLVAALGASSRARESLLPLLGFPLALPLLLPSIQASQGVLDGRSLAALAPQLVLVLSFAVIFWVLGLWFYPLALEDAGDP